MPTGLELRQRTPSLGLLRFARSDGAVGAPLYDSTGPECVAGSGEAERKIALDGIEVVATEAKARFDRDHVVEIDERVDLR
jgi:hypothetical protein